MYVVADAVVRDQVVVVVYEFCLSSENARVRLLHLTDRGRAALETARTYHRAYERRLRARFGDAAIAGMLAAMAGAA